jgi:hypothetical protein
VWDLAWQHNIGLRFCWYCNTFYSMLYQVSKMTSFSSEICLTPGDYVTDSFLKFVFRTCWLLTIHCHGNLKYCRFLALVNVIAKCLFCRHHGYVSFWTSRCSPPLAYNFSNWRAFTEFFASYAYILRTNAFPFCNENYFSFIRRVPHVPANLSLLSPFCLYADAWKWLLSLKSCIALLL